MRAALHRLIQERVELLAIFGTLYVLFLISIFVLIQPRGLNAFVTVIAPLLVLEIILRLLLRFTYGREYRYSLYNYFLVDDPVYGNCFRPNISAKKIDFLICDKYIFKFGEKVNNINLTENKEQRVNFTINSRGFRGPEFTSQKVPGTFRIFCLGGSTTAGNSVNDQETWPVFLEQFLQSKGYRVEVINGGVQGWYSYQDWLRFTKEIVNYEPDLIILSQGWNDEFIYSSQNLGRSWSPRVARHFMEEKYLFIPPNRWLSNTYSLVFHFLVRAYFKNWKFDRQMDFANPQRWACLTQSAYLAAWFETLVDFAREASARGIVLRTINSPVRTDFEKLNSAIPLKSQYLVASQRRIQKILEVSKIMIPLIDVTTAFQHQREKNQAQLFQDDFHPNLDGNRLIGETTADQLIAEGILTPPKNLRPGLKLTDEALKDLEIRASTNDPDLEDFVNEKITTLSALKRQGKLFD